MLSISSVPLAPDLLYICTNDRHVLIKIWYSFTTFHLLSSNLAYIVSTILVCSKIAMTTPILILWLPASGLLVGLNSSVE